MKKELLAPNGKPSNLTPEQYELVRTKAFKEWFGDWEILAKAEILSNDIKGVYKNVALNNIERFLFEISQQANSSDSEYKGAIETVGKSIVNLALKLFPNSRVGDEYIPVISKVVDDNGEPLICYHTTDYLGEINIFNFSEKYDFQQYGFGVYFTDDKKHSESYFEGEKYIVYEVFLNLKNPIILNQKEKGSNKKYFLINREKKNKAGAIIYHPDRRKWNYFIAGEPNQIKLADGSNTTFDANNDDIRFNNGGSVNDKYQYVVDEIKKAIIDLGLPYLNEVDEFNRYYLSKSKNDFGQSWYMIFLQESRPLEIRISDHTVTSSSRIKDEKYIAMLDISNPFKYLKPTGIAKSLDLEFKRLKDIAEKRNKLFDEEREKRDYMNNKLQPFLDKLKLENKTIRKNDRTYQTLEEIIIKHPDWEYIYHYPNNGAFSFYFVKNDKIGSLSPYFINEKYFDFLNDNGYLDNFKRGGRTIAQTPAPKKERIYGSNINKQKSSESNTSAKQIVFDEKTLKSIKNKVDKHNEENPDNKITLSSAKAVVRRGMGAYSKSHRPTIKGGKPNSRVAWGLARLNAFIYKIKNGVSKSEKYIQDDDLINELNIKYNIGGEISKQSINNVKNDKINYLNVLNSVWSFFGIKLD